MRTTIHVTRCHIQAGIQSSNHYCPIARAIRAQAKCSVSVSSNAIYLNGVMWPTPDWIGRIIDNFDDEGFMHSFRFKIPDSVARRVK